MTSTDPGERVALFRDAYARVIERIAGASARVGRDPANVTLLAVSKSLAPDGLRAAVDAGLTLFGENRVQAGIAKAAEVPGARWQLIGPLQGNKVGKALDVFEAIQTVDSVGLAERIDRLVAEARPRVRYPILLQVNVDDDPAKAGFQPAALEAAMGPLAAFERLEVQGLMTIGRLAADPESARGTFRRLRDLSETLRGRAAAIGPALSMGMTDDFELAVEEGATIIRVGRALFGERRPD